MGMTEPCSHGVRTLLSVLPMEPRLVILADEPRWGFLESKCGQRRNEIDTITISRCLRPFRPLFRSLLFIQRRVECPDLAVFVIMFPDGKVRCHPRRQGPIQQSTRHVVVT